MELAKNIQGGLCALHLVPLDGDDWNQIQFMIRPRTTDAGCGHRGSVTGLRSCMCTSVTAVVKIQNWVGTGGHSHLPLADTQTPLSPNPKNLL